MKVVVIGINHAGTSAIRTLLSINPNAEVVAFDRNNNISFLGCGIALTVSGVVQNTNDLFYSNPQELESMGAKVFMNTDVIEIDRKNKVVTVKDLETEETRTESYDKLIYAAGSWPIDLHFKNQELKNIEICKLYQHALKLIEKAKDESIKKVVVVGCGYIGVELVEAYTQSGKQVTLIDVLPRVLGTYYDKNFTDKLEENMKAEGVRLCLNQKVSEFVDDGNGNVCKVITDKEEIEADLVILCIGFKPNGELLPNLKKSGNGAIIVNRKAQSSDPNIYAIGDCAAVFDAATKQYRNIALATNAVKLGIVAASQICGLENVVIPNIVGTNAICVFGLKFASTGVTEDVAARFGLKVKTCEYSDNDRPEWMNTVEKVQVKLVYEEETMRLVGAQILSFGDANHTEWIFSLALAIQLGLNLFQIAFTDVYFLPHLNKPFNFVLSSILKALGMKYIK
ncbi:MAG: FAD-dependent oxidoreductase [Malacoplasma sp.]|nr:FAD-dependent oxidoreductase [Malacoplasma sp.]